jgi:hypothetical protein
MPVSTSAAPSLRGALFPPTLWRAGRGLGNPAPRMTGIGCPSPHATMAIDIAVQEAIAASKDEPAMQDYIRKILGSRVYDVAIESPLDPCRGSRQRWAATPCSSARILQPVFSFKLRGAYNKMAGLPRSKLERGVICASAGNHAQGVALAARKLGIKATIVMPRTTPDIKVQAVRSLGGRVVLHGENFDEAYTHARQLEAEKGLTFIHPYDDPDVIAGQGTVGMEILRQHPDPIEAIFVPIGGGGLAAGVAVYASSCGPSQGHRRRAGGRRQHGRRARGRRAHHARSGRALRRWRRGAAGGRGDLPALPRTARRGHHGFD